MKSGWFYCSAKIIVTTLLKFFWFFGVEHTTKIPESGPLLIIANHCSYFDPPVVGCALPRVVRFFAKEELFHVPILSFLIRNLGAVPLRDDMESVGALRLAMKLLQEGNAVCIFPEGTRSYTGGVAKFLDGAAYLALRTNSPILIVGIIGTFRVLPRGARFPRFWKKISVKTRLMGSPAVLVGYNSGEKAKVDREHVRKLSDAMREEVVKLIGT